MLYSNAQSKNQNQSDILTGLKLLCEPGELYELRAPKTAHDGTVSGYFDDLTKLALPCRLLVRVSHPPSTSRSTLSNVTSSHEQRIASSVVHHRPRRIMKSPSAAACCWTSIPSVRLALAVPMKNMKQPLLVPRNAKDWLATQGLARTAPGRQWQRWSSGVRPGPPQRRSFPLLVENFLKAVAARFS